MPKAEHKEANHKIGTKHKICTKQEGADAEEHPNMSSDRAQVRVPVHRQALAKGNIDKISTRVQLPVTK
jgi:hypothetical protein